MRLCEEVIKQRHEGMVSMNDNAEKGYEQLHEAPEMDYTPHTLTAFSGDGEPEECVGGGGGGVLISWLWLQH